ncbi:MBL fold metallo-hydrolase [Kitasatospora aburaviensis]
MTLALGTVAVCWTVPLLVSRRGAVAGQRRWGRWARAAVAGLLFLVLLAVLLRPPVLTRLATGWPPPGWRLVMCDVGQGDMVVLPTTGSVGDPPDSAVVVDAGPDPHAADRCLRELGITRVPLLLVTHFHADHVEGVPGCCGAARWGRSRGPRWTTRRVRRPGCPGGQRPPESRCCGLGGVSGGRSGRGCRGR